MFNLATLLEELGQWDEAEVLFREELELCRSARGPEDTETENSVTNMARFLQERGKTPELMQLLQELGIGFQIEHIID
ncbi:unnamed protein product [Symbiodinium microadriaticum]|nr:unnamed protein product [Symbiodinium microadriaticum]